MSKIIFAFDEREHATVLAALRHWQKDHPHYVNELEREIAGDDPLSADEIDGLCEDFNMTSPVRLAVTMEGGIIQEILTEDSCLFGVEVVIIDYDTEGADADQLTMIPQSDGKETKAWARLETIGECLVPDLITKTRLRIEAHE